MGKKVSSVCSIILMELYRIFFGSSDNCFSSDRCCIFETSRFLFAQRYGFACLLNLERISIILSEPVSTSSFNNPYFVTSTWVGALKRSSTRLGVTSETSVSHSALTATLQPSCSRGKLQSVSQVSGNRRFREIFSRSRSSRRQSTITRLAFRTGQIRVRANYAVKSGSTLWDLALDIDRVKAISCIFLRGSFPLPLVRWRVTREEKEKYRGRKRWAQNRCSLSVELNKRVTVIITHSGARI